MDVDMGASCNSCTAENEIGTDPYDRTIDGENDRSPESKQLSMIPEHTFKSEQNSEQKLV